jgi:hypothetical protein
MSERIDVANIPPRPKSLVGGYGILIRPHRLPLDELPWEDFERLCVRLLKKDQNNEIARTFGIRGEAQGAIDLYARKRSTGRYEVWQRATTVAVFPRGGTATQAL